MSVVLTTISRTAVWYQPFTPFCILACKEKMLRYIFAFVVLMHGLIHFMGFAKAFQYADIQALTKEISKPAGVLWIITAFLFIAVTVFLVANKSWWWLPAVPAVVLSQILITHVWSDAKWGTIANTIILVAAILSFGSWSFERKYRHDVAAHLARMPRTEGRLITEADLQTLPAPVQRYLRLVGVVNKPFIHDFKILFNGEMRSKNRKWFSFTSEQFDFVDEPTRLFYMKGKMFGLTVPGYHAYNNGDASMKVKLFGMFPLVMADGEMMDQSETVTLFNDMCLLAPATLLNKRITWDAVDDNTAIAHFIVGKNSISAKLLFNEAGELVNFISDDRYAIADRKQYRFTTPVRDYKAFHGYRIGSEGEAVWNYNDGPFVYGKFHLKDVQYNVAAN